MIIDSIQEFLPKYLSPKEQEELTVQLRDFENRPYYSDLHKGEQLQGDGWAGLHVFNFSSGKRDQVKGIILSNSCDISLENKRDLPPKIVFAPLIPLSRYSDRLTASEKLSKEQISAKLSAIRNQSVSSIFYLPSGPPLSEECIAALDDVHSMPTNAFDYAKPELNVFTLSQMGFYLFVLKLSIHFCRFQEGLSRSVSS